MHIVIIGGSLNAITAAAHLRRESEKNRITLIAKSAELGNAACGIPDFLQGAVTDISDLKAASPQLLQKVFNLELLLDIDILQINSKIKILHLSNKRKLPYDKLIFAASPLHLRPDIKGILGDNIFTLHNTEAARRVNDYFWGMKAQKILILGGSRLGVQTATAFAANKAQVTIIEKSSHLLSYVDAEFASLVQKKLIENSINVLTSITVKEFYPHHAILSDGSRYNYDMAIITTGSHNEVRLPVTTDIKLGESGGIIVNEVMQTNINDIFACGENIELHNSISGLPFRIRNASLAAQTAKIAADGIMKNPSHLPLIFNNEIIELFDNYLGICGCSEEELNKADISYHKVYLNTELCENYILPPYSVKMKLLFNKQGNILGFQIFGSRGVFTRLNIVAALMQKKGKVSDLTEFYPAYSPSLARTKDSLNIIGSLAYAIQTGDLKIIDFKDLQKGNILINLGASLSINPLSSIDIINLPFAQFRSKAAALPKNQIIALYCRNGYSAYLAYCLLHSLGFDNVFLLNSPFEW